MRRHFFGVGVGLGGPSKSEAITTETISGADGARTRDLHAASVALSQLSYGPKRPSEYRHGRGKCQHVRYAYTGAALSPPSIPEARRARGTQDGNSRGPRR